MRSTYGPASFGCPKLSRRENRANCRFGFCVSDPVIGPLRGFLLLRLGVAAPRQLFGAQ